MLTIATPHGRTHFFVSSARTIQMHWHFSAERANAIAVLIAARLESKDAWETSTRYCFAELVCTKAFGHGPAAKASYWKICP